MALKRDEYYWIEKANGELLTVCRLVDFYGDLLTLKHRHPELCKSENECMSLCRRGEKPVRVRLVKVEE